MAIVCSACCWERLNDWPVGPVFTDSGSGIHSFCGPCGVERVAKRLAGIEPAMSWVRLDEPIEPPHVSWRCPCGVLNSLTRGKEAGQWFGGVCTGCGTAPEVGSFVPAYEVGGPLIDPTRGRVALLGGKP